MTANKDKIICYKCGKVLEENFDVKPENILCFDCRNDFHFFKYARHIFKYCGGIEKIIKRYKYSKKKYLHKFISEEYIRFLNLNSGFFGVDNISFITNVPMYRQNLKIREYDHIDIICKYISEKLNIAYKKNLLLKTVHTEHQAGLKREDRLVNLKNSFIINPVYSDFNFKNNTILLIDDVLTTGATVNEISKVLLKKHKSANIYVLTLARGG